MLLALREYLVVAGYVCLSFLAVAAQPFSAASAEEPTQKGQRRWVLEAEELVGKLGDLARGTPEIEKPDFREYKKFMRWVMSWRVGKQHASFRRAQKLLCRLWLTTGMPPLLLRPDESLRACLNRNASAYRDYVAEHANLADEELHRLGLANSLEAFASPLWYMTLKNYLSKKASLSFDSTVFIHVSRSSCLFGVPLTTDSYTRLSAALSTWLDANEGGMIWDSDARSFRPRKGKYVGTAQLSRTVVTRRRTNETESIELRR